MCIRDRGKSRTLLPEVAQKRAQMVRCCLILLRSPVDSGTATRPERRLLCQVVTPLDSERRECMLEFYRRSGARSSRAKKQLQNLVDSPGLSLWVDCTRTSCIPVKTRAACAPGKSRRHMPGNVAAKVHFCTVRVGLHRCNRCVSAGVDPLGGAKVYAGAI